MAKSIIKQFDVPCNQGSGDQELQDLAEGLGVEDYEMISAISTDPDVDDVDGSVDEIIDMDVEDQANLEQSIRPVRMVLTKVSNDSPCPSRTHLFLPDSQVGLQDYQFSDGPLACMGCCLQGGRLEREANPMRCVDMVEFELRHGGLRC